MFDQLLFPTDGSDGADAVLDHVVDMAAAHDATLHLLHVAPPEPERRPSLTGGSEGDGAGDDPSERRRSDGERFVSDAAARASQSDVTAVTSVERGEPYQVITEYAAEQGADLVVMPTHGRTGLSRLLLGSTTERVVRRSDVPVLTVRPDAATDLAYPYADVLTPTDGSACATAAVTFGSELAAATDAALHAVSVVNVAAFGADIRGPLLLDELEERASDAVDAASDTAAAAGVETIRKSVGRDVSIHDGILAYIDEYDVDIVVMGTHGHTGFDRYMLGSVAEKLVRSSPVPVVTVRQPREE
ncbi:universal stress protein [Haloferax volcanii]|uniref:UspA domain-containing protein n=3 Tax=Haloferax volcanii TaxID=2246 RepID=A0A384LL74_HALVD|nr:MULTISPECIES: universal stress protein [Haloferax]ADE04896.1 UspA domain protein [Haloferax volcanii DS2]ELY33748.1 UspA domain-containing protein [Haloferax volcanii DS2]MBS8119221.1 universal stress protein [Haloferax volcanii]MBS8124234.1 universal stress protein [Haloferax volcanii]MBS8128103.1 universal stress protein [Haloferax volcanii]